MNNAPKIMQRPPGHRVSGRSVSRDKGDRPGGAERKENDDQRRAID